MLGNCILPLSTHIEAAQYRQNFMEIDSAPKDLKDGIRIQQIDPLANHSEKLQKDLHELGQKIKHNEENEKYLQSFKNNLEESSLELQEALRKYGKAVNKNPTHLKGEEETVENILRHEKSAAALLCGIKRQAEALSSDHSLTKDIIGIVATLGKVGDDNLSRLLSEYLGPETMLAVVCKTHEGVKALEAYNKEGSIDKSSGIHAFAASIESPIHDRFIVICLEDLMPYAGEVLPDDHQRRLALLEPRLLSGEIPPGFLGFAVNMISIDGTNLHYISNSGHNLRETLFYYLFSNLQVYKSREDMLNAFCCITSGAISMDGGMIRSSGVFSLGHHKGEMAIKFSTCFERMSLPESYFEIEKKMKMENWKKDHTMDEVKRVQAILNHERFNYEMKKQEILQLLAGGSPRFPQCPTGRVSTPR